MDKTEANNIGMRLNNPGNIKDPSTGAFRTFASPEEGYQALIDDIKIKQSGQSKVIKPGASLQDFASVWAPASDNNDPQNYAHTLATNLGVAPTTPFDHVPADKLAGAIQVAEGTSTMPISNSPKPKLTRAQVIENINAMDSQGASQEDIQSYLDSLNQSDSSATDQNTTAPTGVQPNPSFTGTNDQGPADFKIGGIKLGDTDLTNTEGSTAATTNENTLTDALAAGKSLVSSTIATGSDIAAAIGGNTMAPTFDALAKSDQSYVSTLIGLRNQAAKSGNKDEVDHFQNLIKNYKTTSGESITDIFPALNKSTEQVLGDFAGTALELVGGAEGADSLVNLAKGGAKAAGGEIADSFGKRLLKSSATGAAYGAGFGTTGAMQENAGAKDIAKSAAIGAGEGAIVGAGTEVAGSVLNKTLGRDLMKTGDLMKVKPEDVSKLPPKDQVTWYKENAKRSIQLGQEAATKDVEQAKSEITNVSQQLADTNEDKRVTLKEPVKQLYRDMGERFQSMAEGSAENSPNMGKTITTEDLSAKIDSKFEHDPDKGFAPALKEELGIKKPEPLTPEQVAAGAKEPEPVKLTNQQLLDKARGIMAGVSKAAKNGDRVYTSAEYEAMKKYSFIMEVLGDNGVDLSEANKMWRNWVPVRDKMYKEVQPFDESGAKTGKLGTTINKANATPSTPAQAKGQLEAKNWLKTIEDHLKLPEGSLTEESDALMKQLENAKLTKANARRVATEAAAEVRKQMRYKTTDIKNLAERKANVRKIISKVIKIATGIYLGRDIKGTAGEVVGGILGGSL